MDRNYCGNEYYREEFFKVRGLDKGGKWKGVKGDLKGVSEVGGKLGEWSVLEVKRKVFLYGVFFVLNVFDMFR